MRPHKCPVCNGTGIVSSDFYKIGTSYIGSTSNITEPCRSCNGSGIIYTYETYPVYPQPKSPGWESPYGGYRWICSGTGSTLRNIDKRAEVSGYVQAFFDEWDAFLGTYHIEPYARSMTR